MQHTHKVFNGGYISCLLGVIPLTRGCHCSSVGPYFTCGSHVVYMQKKKVVIESRTGCKVIFFSSRRHKRTNIFPSGYCLYVLNFPFLHCFPRVYLLCAHLNKDLKSFAQFACSYHLKTLSHFTKQG